LQLDGVVSQRFKATSVDATLKALEAFASGAGKVVLILVAAADRTPLRVVRAKVRKLVLIGEDPETIERELVSTQMSNEQMTCVMPLTDLSRRLQW
jgi:UDP-N-acetylmuramoylalanine-D-glutamate ligase